MTDTTTIKAQLLDLLVAKNNAELQVEALKDRISGLQNFLGGVQYADSLVVKPAPNVETGPTE